MGEFLICERGLYRLSSRFFAAIDLGSNSFRLLLCEAFPEGTCVYHSFRHRVQLAKDLDEHGITPDAQQRAADAIRDFKQQLPHKHPLQLKAIATQAFRMAVNGPQVLQPLEQLLQAPIEILDGLEEARLIYKAIAHQHPTPQPLLTIDIGGGSTEVVLGHHGKPLHRTSIPLGCVTVRNHYFLSGTVNEAEWARVERFCLEILPPYLEAFIPLPTPLLCIGSSGSIASIAALVPLKDDHWTLADLLHLKQQLLALGHEDRFLSLPLLTAERQSLLAPGLAILMALFQHLNLSHMRATEASLKEGVLLELMSAEEYI